MPRYFFDIQDGGLHRDEDGVECRDLDAVRDEAMRILPDIVRDVALDKDRSTYTLIVRDEQRRPVFTTTLSITGLWLSDTGGA